MSLEGNLVDFSIQEVIQLFTIGKKTGVIKFKHGNFEGRIALVDGLVYFAESSFESGSLSERLVRERKITEKAIRQAQGLKKINKDKNSSIVKILISGNYIDEQSLKLAIKNLLVDAIFDIGLNRDCLFVFEPDETIEDEFAILKLDSSEIESELIRRNKTWEAIVKKIPDFNAVYVLDYKAAEQAAEIRLKPVEWKIICLLNGENTAATVAEALNLSRYKVGKSLYGLLSAGLIRPLEVSGYVAEEYFAEEGEG